MGNKRVIDGDIALSKSFNALSRDARLTFVLLWEVADNTGRFVDAPSVVMAGTYPLDDDVTDEMLAGWIGEIVAEGCLHRYVVDGCGYYHFPAWKKFQKLRRETSKWPAPKDDCSTCRQCPDIVRTASGHDSDGVRTASSKRRPEEKRSEVEEKRSEGKSAPAARATTDLTLFEDASDGVISPDRLVSLLAKDPGDDDAKLEWLEYNLPVMLCEIEALGPAITTRKQAMAKLRTLIFRWYRHQHKTNGSRASPVRQAPENFDEARIRKNAEWLESLA